MTSQDLLDVPEIKQAIELAKESYYTKGELETYDKYWDTIRTEKTFIADAEAKGQEIGLAKGQEITNIKVILNLYDKGSDIDFISQVVNLDEQTVVEILTQNNRK